MAWGITERQPDTNRANFNREFPVEFGRTWLENRPKPSWVEDGILEAVGASWAGLVVKGWIPVTW